MKLCVSSLIVGLLLSSVDASPTPDLEVLSSSINNIAITRADVSAAHYMNRVRITRTPEPVVEISGSRGQERSVDETSGLDVEDPPSSTASIAEADPTGTLSLAEQLTTPTPTTAPSSSYDSEGQNNGMLLEMQGDAGRAIVPIAALTLSMFSTLALFYYS